MPISKILVVDDSPTERLALQELLAREGYQVVSAESGEQAIAASKSEKPDLILMDVVMPGMNGYQATRTISRDDSTRNITEEALEHAKGHLRSELAKRIKLFKTPELHFKYDESLERGADLSKLIQQAVSISKAPDSPDSTED